MSMQVFYPPAPLMQRRWPDYSSIPTGTAVDELIMPPCTIMLWFLPSLMTFPARRSSLKSNKGSSNVSDAQKAPSRVAVVILNWRNWEDTIVCAESVLRNDYPDFQAVVVDNGSPNGSMEHIKEWAEGRLSVPEQPRGPLDHLIFPPVKKPIPYVEYDRAGAEHAGTLPDVPLVLIQTGSNLGYGGGNNVALRYLFRKDSDAYALILNNDAAITPDFLSRAMARVQEEPTLEEAVVGFPAYSFEEPEQLDTAYIQERFPQGPTAVVELPEVYEPLARGVMAHGAAMLITPAAPVKLIPEEYFLYNEDSDYCRQIYEHGGSIVVQLDSPVYMRGESKSVGWGSPLQIYYTRRNKLAYCKKYYSTTAYGLILARMFCSTVLGLLRSLLSGERKAAKAYFLAFLHHLQGKKGRTWV